MPRPVKDFFCTFHKNFRVLIFTFIFYTFIVYTCDYDFFWAVLFFFIRDGTSYITTFSSTISYLFIYLFIWCGPFLKSLICYNIVSVSYLAFWPWDMWDLISLTRGQRLDLNHCTAWGILVLLFLSSFLPVNILMFKKILKSLLMPSLFSTKNTSAIWQSSLYHFE